MPATRRTTSTYLRTLSYDSELTDPRHSDDVIAAAWEAGIGVHALVWFGFDGDDKWKTRRDALFASIKSNPKAPFVTRVVQFGSEPLFDGVLSPEELTTQVQAAQKTLKSVGVPVTVSEMQYGYAENGGAQNVLDAIDSINIHMLPFFAGDAGKAKDAWPIVQRDLNWFIKHGKGKKMYLDEVSMNCCELRLVSDFVLSRTGGHP